MVEDKEVVEVKEVEEEEDQGVGVVVTGVAEMLLIHPVRVTVKDMVIARTTAMIITLDQDQGRVP